MKTKIFLSILLIGLLSAGSVYYYVFIYSVKHHRSADNEKCIVVNAVDLVKEYQTNEAIANTKYLDKALQINGIVGEVKKAPSGNTTISLKSDDPFSGVFCTIVSTDSSLPKAGSPIILKGLCKGYLSDVIINDALITK